MATVKIRYVFVLLAVAALALPPTVEGQVLTATLTAPSDGATNVSPVQTMQWTSVPGAQAYVVWVGTTVGAKDAVNSPEILQTSYQPANLLPSGQTLYARMWTKVGDVWRSVDSTFTTGSVTATLTSPANGATNVSPLQPIQWTSVTNAQAYVLWVGTTAGAMNVVNTPEILQTSYQPVSVPPASQTLYARMWTKVGGVWRYTDSTFTAASLTASLTAPSNGQTNVNPLAAIQWTSVADAQAYVLWVGTTLGAHDSVNTPEVLPTSFQPASLPANQTLYARIWVRVGGVWRFTDSTFTAASLAPTLTAPVNGATNVAARPVFQWSSVLNADAYVIWVGTTAGTNNVINTNEQTQTSYQPSTNLPINQVLYARVWARVGSWRSSDITFTTQTAPATMTTPADGQANFSPLQAMQWTSAPSAEAYVVWVGTTAGTNNVVNTAEMQQTSYQSANLPPNQTLYARLWTRINGTWLHTDSTFSASSLAATIIYPADAAQNINDETAATWTSVAGAQSYILWGGTTPGGNDLLSGSMETQRTSYSIAGLPTRRTLYTRLWTNAGGTWRHGNDTTFSVAPVAPEFVYPLNGATGVSLAQPFQWTVSRRAQAYKLTIGLTPGGNDLADSGDLATTSYTVTGVSHPGTLFARVWSKIDDVWARHTDIAFTLDAAVAAATMDAPSDGQIGFSTSRPFEWTPEILASGYRLSIGTTPGGADLHDSGEIHVTSRFVPNLPLGTPLYGRLQTKIDGLWYPSDFAFSVGDNAVSTALRIKSALQATDVVRTMASDDDGRPFGWTGLSPAVWPRYNAVRGDFTVLLLQVLTDINIGLPTRRLDIAFDTNNVDVHTLVEMLNPGTGEWMLLDPTFDLTVKRPDGSFATAADLSTATRAFNWSGISYELLGAAQGLYLTQYYLDYPLLYLNVSQPLVPGQGESPVPYLQAVPLPAAAAAQRYLIRCTGSSSADVMVEGTLTSIACNGIDSLSVIFSAVSVAEPVGSPTPFQLYSPRRFVF